MPILIAVMGPTASGKTELAEKLADLLDAQLINADAFQAYQGMDIGTAKPLERQRYELIDIKSPDEGYGVGEFVLRSQDILSRLFGEERSAILVGGTGLYIRALMEEYGTMQGSPDPALRSELNRRKEEEGLAGLVRQLLTEAPEVAQRTDLKNPVRVIRALERLHQPASLRIELPPYQRQKLAIVPDSQVLNSRIEQRTVNMVQNGWVREVEILRQAGYGPKDPGFRAIGYRQIWEHLEGQVELEAAIATTIAETRRYAKRQRTWLRSEPNLTLLEGNDLFRRAADLVQSALK